MWIKVNMNDRVLCELVWREWVQRAFVYCCSVNKIKETTFYQNFIIKITN